MCFSVRMERNGPREQNKYEQKWRAAVVYVHFDVIRSFGAQDE